MCVCICMCVCVYIYTCIYIYIYTHTHMEINVILCVLCEMFDAKQKSPGMEVKTACLAM